MSISPAELAARTDLGGILEKLLPGCSPANQRLREQIRSFCDNFLCCGALLLGPIGSGKSTVARVIAVLRLLSLLTPEQRKNFLIGLRFDGPVRIDKRSLNWYDELNLTGLSPTLADAQLFGIAPKAATGVDAREAIFEKVGHGQGRTNDNPTIEAQLTRGVILLDEIADMDRDLQPKLLTVLTGAEVYRLGGETTGPGFTFRGLVLCATWRDAEARRPDGTAHIRPDLLSRLADYRIDIPGLNERPEDLESIVALQVEDLHRRLNDRVNELRTLRYNNASIDHPRLQTITERRLLINRSDMKLLANHDWSRSGEMRGLRQVLERSLLGDLPIPQALQQQPILSAENDDRSNIASLADSILQVAMAAGHERPTLPGRIKGVETQVRRRVQAVLLGSDVELRRRAAQLGISPTALRKQVNDLFRQDRARATADEG